MEPIIKIQDLRYEYTQVDDKEVAAIDGVSLKIYAGEFVVIIGHNGSGKSTLAKLLNALFQPTDGVVEIKGMNTADESYTWSIRQIAGMVFQNPDNQLVATIVEEDVAFGPENLGVPSAEIRLRVDQALTSVSMSEYAKSAPHMLSGGQKQRIAIAGIIAMKPEIIILDEPTAMLDPSGRKEVLETIHRLNLEENITIVHITHFMEEAIDADRLIVMEDGKVVMDGRPKDVFARVTELKNIGLDVPQMTELSYMLRQQGLLIPDDIIRVEEMRKVLCQYL